jgi:hypothetical protein
MWWGRTLDLALCLFFFNTRLSVCIYRSKSVCPRPLSCRKMSGKQTDYSRRFSAHSLCCGNSPQIVIYILRYVYCIYLRVCKCNTVQPCRCKGSFEKQSSKKSRQCDISCRELKGLKRQRRAFYTDTKLVFHFLH